jgi:hypothetical protein
MAGSSEHGSGPLGSIKGEEFLHWLRDCPFLRGTLFVGVNYSVNFGIRARDSEEKTSPITRARFKPLQSVDSKDYERSS